MKVQEGSMTKPKKVRRRTAKADDDGVAEMASAPFEPFTPKTLVPLYRLATWEGINNPHLINLRIAIEVMGRTKASVGEMAMSLWDEPVKDETKAIDGSEANVFTVVIEGMHESANIPRGLAEVLQSAECRLICGLAAKNEQANRKH